MNNIKLAPIPKLFKSDLTGDTFKHCVSCECDLHDKPEGYLIEKAIKPYFGFKSFSTIFEYAMCLPCMEKMKNELSESAKTNVQNYFMRHMNFDPKITTGNEHEDPDISEWVDECMVYGTKVEELGECQIMAHCVGDNILYQQLPYMISSQVSDDILALLSQKSKDELENFKNNFPGGTPEFMELLEKKTVFV